LNDEMRLEYRILIDMKRKILSTCILFPLSIDENLDPCNLSPWNLWIPPSSDEMTSDTHIPGMIIWIYPLFILGRKVLDENKRMILWMLPWIPPLNDEL
jgi:hypothetical protein